MSTVAASAYPPAFDRDDRDLCLATFMLIIDTSMISYPNYKFIFPIKALGMYARRFPAAQSNGSI